MSLRAFRLAAACAAIASLSGCTFLGIDFNDEKVQYESSNSRANLEVPPDLTPIQNDNRFAVPSRNGVVSANAEAQRAQAASGQDPSAASSRIVPLTVSAKVMKDGKTLAGRAGLLAFRRSRRARAESEDGLYGNGMGGEPRQASSGHYSPHGRQDY